MLDMIGKADCCNLKCSLLCFALLARLRMVG